MKSTANPLPTSSIDWVPLRAGIAMRPLHFEENGYALQLKIEPGAMIPRHRHTGEVHALNISGYREIIDTGEIVGPGDYVYEAPGNVDSWRCYGAEPCIVHISLTGRVEYLDEAGSIMSHTDRHTALANYLDHCALHGVQPDSRIVGIIGT